MLRDAIRRNPKLAAGGLALLGVAAFLQSQIDPLRRQKAIEPPSQFRIGQVGLPFEYTLAAFSGFRQVIAGLLWVRSDAFFHAGNYDAILPLLRLITWLDPNWLDVYATGAWHIMYNFTDTDQRSDRRYLPPGSALLDEGIANNPTVYDIYKEKGWAFYDKVKNYAVSVEALEGAMAHDPKADTNQVVHLLGHAYERNGQDDKAIEVWKKAIDLHQQALNDPKLPEDRKWNNKSGLNNAKKNHSMLLVRKECRARDTQPPVDADFHFQVKRVKPRVLEVSGSWQLIGALKDQFDAGEFEADNVTIKKIGKGIIKSGPVDGARVDVRLQDAGYVMPKEAEFSFEVDKTLTIMQDQLTVKGGKRAVKGGVYMEGKPVATNTIGEKAGCYLFTPEEAAPLKGVPLDKAMAGAAPISAEGQWQLVTMAYLKGYREKTKFYRPEEVGPAFARLKADSAKIQELVKAGVKVSQADLVLPGKFRREIDMSKDPQMYSFAKDKFDLILSFNPRTAPDFVQDRIGLSGEGLTDKKYIDTTFQPGNRMIRVIIPLTREQILGDKKDEILARG